MLSLWNLYLLLPLSSPLSLQVTGENVREAQQPDSDAAAQRLTGPPQKPHGSGFAAGRSVDGAGSVELPVLTFSWPLSSSEESDRQGVIGEYGDLQERTDTYLISRTTESTEDDATSKGSSQLQPAKEQQTFLLPGSLQSEQGSATPLFAGTEGKPEHATPTVATGSWGWATDPSGAYPVKTGENITDILHTGAVSMEEDTDDSDNDDLLVSKTSDTLWLDGEMATSPTPCKTSNQSWPPTCPDELIPDEPLLPSLVHSPAFFVPLYSDWNSALATWGFAWEAHIYGLGSVFTVFCLISVVCLLGLPLRCPPGIPYLILLHFLLLTFAGIQSFSLLYDAYSHQDRLPLLCSVLLSELPFPCLISAFSLAILLLSLCSRVHLSLDNSTSFSVLPKPCLLLCMSLVHFVVSLGCAGMLQLFNSLPTVILLFPQGLFVCLTIFLSCSYLIFYCLIQVNTKHIYRLNDNGESAGSPEEMRPASSPFAKVEDWGRAAGAGVGASLCLLGCGGLQLYGILHVLGLGGVDGYGFQPWPWWGYQVGCRLCEVGVCLSLSLIGTHPLFCHNNSSIKTNTHPRPGSWSRLSCSSPSRVLTLTSQAGVNSPVLSSHDSFSQSKQEKLVVCDVISKGQSEVIPLFSMVDSFGNGVDCVPKSNQTHNTLLPLSTFPSPPRKPRNEFDSQQSSLDSLQLDTYSTVDLQPPSPINLSRSIDQALFSESLFSHSVFAFPKLYHTSSSISLSSHSQGISKQGPRFVEKSLYHTSSCSNVDQENALSSSRPSKVNASLTSHSKPPLSPEKCDWKGSVSGSTQGLCSNPKEKGKLRSHSWANRGQNFAQSSLPRAIPHLSYHRHYRALSLASPESHGSGQLTEIKHLSESKQLEWDLAVQAEFVNVCKQIDTLSVCSDTIEL